MQDLLVHQRFFLVLFEGLNEFAELFWKDISLWQKIQVCGPMLFLHLVDVYAESILARYFVALRKMIDLLKLVETLEQVALA